MTLLVGALTTTSHGTVGNGTQNIQYGAVWTAVATGTATTMSIGLNSTNTGNLVLAIYNAAGTTRLGYTNPFAQSLGTNTQSLMSSVAITSGTQYLLTVETSGFYIDVYNNGAATFSDPYDYITYSSPPPATMTLGTDWGNGFPSLSADGTSGTAYNLTAATGTFALTGETATRDFAMPGAQGAFALTGHAATAGYGLGASEGAFGLTGNAATLAWSGAPVPKGSRGAHWSLSPAIGLCV